MLRPLEEPKITGPMPADMDEWIKDRTMKTAQHISEQQVREALADVMDPEIPNLSIIDLGIVRNVAVSGEAIEVELMPTFVGCPALEMMKESVHERLRELAPEHAIEVMVT